MSHQRYFNFPVCLLKDFLTDSKTALINICNYSVYAYSLLQAEEDEVFNIMHALDFFDIDCDYPERSLSRGEAIYDKVEFHAPKVGLNVDIFWDFYKNEKTEFEKICLLAFLGIKSILGNKAYCKTDNKYLLSRMNGSAGSHDRELLSELLKKYANEYQLKKIKNELSQHWGLKTYSRYTRGFYVSFSYSLEELMYEAEKNRKRRKMKLQKQEEKQLLDKVLKKLESQGY